jgi:predicted phosphoribosyltransferase
MKYRDRTEAGAALGDVLATHPFDNPVVIGLARGGVVVAAAVAERLGAPIDVIVPRKIGHPLSPEFAIGAVTEIGEPIWGGAIDAAVASWRTAEASTLQDTARRLSHRFRAGRPPLSLDGRTAILVDDGIATGLTMLASARAAYARGASRVVAATPVSPVDVRARLAPVVDVLISLIESPGFGAVGEYYVNFEQVSDAEVEQLLRSTRPQPSEAVDLPGLDEVLASVDQYPTSSAHLARKARELHAPEKVVAFFESIPGGTTFADKRDVVNRSSVTELILEQERSEPDEHVVPGD